MLRILLFRIVSGRGEGGLKESAHALVGRFLHIGLKFVFLCFADIGYIFR